VNERRDKEELESVRPKKETMEEGISKGFINVGEKGQEPQEGKVNPAEEEEGKVNPAEEEERKADPAEEEAEEAMVIKVEVKPSKEEVEKHNTTHLPWRSWCKYCVFGRGKNRGHRKQKHNGNVPTVHADYMYMKEDEKERKKRKADNKGEEYEDDGMPILVMKEKPGGWITAHVMPEKGVHPYSVKRVNQTMKLLGYKKIILRTDQEPSILALKSRVKEEWAGDLIAEESPVGESESNGVAERAVQEVQGMIRTVKEGLESRLGSRLTGNEPVAIWLITHSGQLVNRYKVGEDGRTAWQRIKGKNPFRSLFT